jgi:hypothetical protein
MTAYVSPLLALVAARRRRWIFFENGPHAHALHAVSRSCLRTLCDLPLEPGGPIIKTCGVEAPLAYVELFRVRLVQTPGAEIVAEGKTRGEFLKQVRICWNCERHPAFGVRP